jgi:hypothetical protein
MEADMPIQYITDARGEKGAVVVPLIAIAKSFFR